MSAPSASPAPSSSYAPDTLDGWFALHDVRYLDWPALAGLSAAERRAAAESLVAYAHACEAVNGSGQGSSAAYRVVGHKGDLLFLHFRPAVADLAELERRFEATRLAAFTRRAYTYLSVVELSRHAAPPMRAGVDPASVPEIARRLHPDVPPRSHLCFYPMSKRRGETVNWYRLAPEARRDLMRSHGRIGHAYADRVTQIITGSMGLDDWEWGVSLFADDPLVFKKLVYEMRFDEASAAYAEFGPFYVGIRMMPEHWAAWLNEAR